MKKNEKLVLLANNIEKVNCLNKMIHKGLLKHTCVKKIDDYNYEFQGDKLEICGYCGTIKKINEKYPVPFLEGFHKGC